jgi:hypothetical protein
MALTPHPENNSHHITLLSENGPIQRCRDIVLESFRGSRVTSTRLVDVRTERVTDTHHRFDSCLEMAVICSEIRFTWRWLGKRLPELSNRRPKVAVLRRTLWWSSEISPGFLVRRPS